MAASTPIDNEAKSAKEENQHASKMKYISLAVLTLHQAIVGLCMRYAAIRTSREDRFFSSTGKGLKNNTSMVDDSVSSLIYFCLLFYPDSGSNGRSG